MDRTQIRRRLCEHAGLRVGEHMATYALEQMESPLGEGGFFVMGGEARTGRPMRIRITQELVLTEPVKDAP